MKSIPNKDLYSLLNDNTGKKKVEKPHYLFVSKKDPVKLSEKVKNDHTLKQSFSQPVSLDTRSFQLLHYGVDKIYGRVNESSEFKKDKITHGRKQISLKEAVTLSEELHKKFRGGQVKDQADFLERTTGDIRDLLDDKIYLRNKYDTKVLKFDYKVKKHSCLDKPLPTLTPKAS